MKRLEGPPPALAHLRDELHKLRDADRLRSRPEPSSGAMGSRRIFSFCSNDYLGLAARPAPPLQPSGAGASRLIAGERSQHRELEGALARWLDVEDVLAFSSGYAANLGTLAALLQPQDRVVSDALNHASLIDGIRLARCEVVVVPHLNHAAVQRALEAPRDTTGSAAAPARDWVVTESYFSMDADAPDLQALRTICDRSGAGLFVDEAHALGVRGPEGRGGCAAAGVRPDVLVGTLGKAFGASGAFVAGCRVLTDWLWNRARSFVFSTGMSPVVAAAALDNLQITMREPAPRERVQVLAARFRAGLGALGADIRGEGHIVPWVLGDDRHALAAATELQRRDVHAVAVRPPTVPAGSSRVRFTVTAAHDEAAIDHAILAVRETLACLG